MRGYIPLLPQYAFMAWCIVKHRGNFTFTFYSSADIIRIIKLSMRLTGYVERKEDIKLLAKFMSEICKGRDHLRVVDEGGKVILKLILKK
jgi:hypothetical protein